MSNTKPIAEATEHIKMLNTIAWERMAFRTYTRFTTDYGDVIYVLPRKAYDA